VLLYDSFPKEIPMDLTLVALIVPVWNWLAAGQNTVVFGIVIAAFANVVVLFNLARLLFVHQRTPIELT
jgi:drug/metabolite transporter superfamily protein YnfA